MKTASLAGGNDHCLVAIHSNTFHVGNQNLGDLEAAHKIVISVYYRDGEIAINATQLNVCLGTSCAATVFTTFAPQTPNKVLLDIYHPQNTQISNGYLSCL